MVLTSAKEQHSATSPSSLPSKSKSAGEGVASLGHGDDDDDDDAAAAESGNNPVVASSGGGKVSEEKGKSTQTRFAFYSASSTHERNDVMNTFQGSEVETTRNAPSSGNEILQDLTKMGGAAELDRNNRVDAGSRAELHSDATHSQETYDSNAILENLRMGEKERLQGQRRQQEDQWDRERMNQSEQDRQPVGPNPISEQDGTDTGKNANVGIPAGVRVSSGGDAPVFTPAAFDNNSSQLYECNGPRPPAPPQDVLPPRHIQPGSEAFAAPSSRQAQHGRKSQVTEKLLVASEEVTRPGQQPTPKHRNILAAAPSDEVTEVASPNRKFYAGGPSPRRLPSPLSSNTPSRRHPQYQQQHRPYQRAPGSIAPSDEAGMGGCIPDTSHPFEEAVRDALHILRRRVERLSELAASSQATTPVSSTDDAGRKPSYQISETGGRPPPPPSIVPGQIREGYALSPAEDVRKAALADGLFRRVDAGASPKLTLVAKKQGRREEENQTIAEEGETPMSPPKQTRIINNDLESTSTGQRQTDSGSFPSLSSNDWRPDSFSESIGRNGSISDGQGNDKNFVSDMLDAVLGPIPSLPPPPPPDNGAGETPTDYLSPSLSTHASAGLSPALKAMSTEYYHSSDNSALENNDDAVDDDGSAVRISNLRLGVEAADNRPRKLELERRWRQEEEVERGVERVLTAILARCNSSGSSVTSGHRSALHLHQITTSVPLNESHAVSKSSDVVAASSDPVAGPESIVSAHDSVVSIVSPPPSIAEEGTWKTTSSGGLEEADVENDDDGGDTIEESFTKLGGTIGVDDDRALLGDFGGNGDVGDSRVVDEDGKENDTDADDDVEGEDGNEFDSLVVENRASVVEELLAETEDEDDEDVIENIISQTDAELTMGRVDVAVSSEEQTHFDALSSHISTSQTSMSLAPASSSFASARSEDPSLPPLSERLTLSSTANSEMEGAATKNDHHHAPQVIPYSTSSDGMVGVEAIHMNESTGGVHPSDPNTHSRSSKVLGPLSDKVGGTTGVVLDESMESNFEISATDSTGARANEEMVTEQTLDAVANSRSPANLEVIGEKKEFVLAGSDKETPPSPGILASLSEVVRKAPNNLMAVLSNPSGQETSSEDDEEEDKAGTMDKYSLARDGIFSSDTASINKSTSGTSGMAGPVSEDREAAALMRRLCAHLLPYGVDKRPFRTDRNSLNASNGSGSFGRWLACETISFEGAEPYPSWDREDPDEAGYVVHRLSKSSLQRVEREFQRMVNTVRRSSEMDLLRRDAGGNGNNDHDKKTERLYEKRKKLEEDDRGVDEEFERELEEAEEMLDREEKRHEEEERRKRDESGGDVKDHGDSKNSESTTKNDVRRREDQPSRSDPREDNKPTSKHTSKPLVANPNFPHVRPSGGGKIGELELFHLPIIYKAHQTGFEPHKDLSLESGNVFAGQFLVQNELGSAAFSTAYRCIDLNSGQIGEDGEEYHDEVCLKVIKNTKDFFDQSLDEIKILEMLRQTGECQKNNIVEMKSFFYHREHLVIVTELLRQNLFEFGRFILDNDEPAYFTRLRLCYITRQVLVALGFVHKLGLVHSDVKPENILLSSYSKARVKLIDFGSSCFLTDRQSSYIQSRSYRAPEVVLGLPYDGKIDVWSLGCVVAEMYTGQVTFQNDSVVSMLSRMEAICGAFPRHMIANGRQAGHFFTASGLLYERLDGDEESDGPKRTPSSVLDLDDDTSGVGDKRDETYYNIYQPKATTLAERLGFDPDFMEKEHTDPDDVGRAMFVDFIRYLLTIDPDSRPTAEEALKHPWITSGLKLTERDIKYPPE